MIDFRYHLVSIVAVFLALAIGIVLGSTELQGHTLDVLQSTSDSLRNQLSAASAQRDSYQSQAGAAEQFLQNAEPTLLGGRLTGRKAVLITEPGASSGVISGARQAATTAGATVTGQLSLQPKFNDISGATQSSLAAINSSLASDNGITLVPGAAAQTSYQQQAAQLIAAAVLTKSDNSNNSATGSSSGGGGSDNSNKRGSASNPASTSTSPASGGLSAASAGTLLSAYVQAGYLSVSGTPTDRATLAIIVVPGDAPSGGQNDPVNQVLIAAAQEFASASAATVVAGTTGASSQQGNSVSVLRSSSASAQMSTVDNADTMLGQISVAEALASQLAGRKPNSYGISGASSVSPDPLPSAIATPSAPPSANSHQGTTQPGKTQQSPTQPSKTGKAK